MTPAARIQATIDVMTRTQNARVPMDTVCGDYFRQRRYIGSKDRAEIAERVYEIARHHARLTWLAAQAKVEFTPRTQVLLHLRHFEGLEITRIAHLCDGSKYGPDKLSDDEQALLRFSYKAAPPEAVKLECPPEFEARLRDIFGEGFADEMEAMLSPAPLDLRVNTLLADREKVKAFLEADGVETTETPFAPQGLRTKGKTYLSKTKAFNRGWIEIQDEGSQLIAALCEAKGGMSILDYCAGAGGKTLALAASMKGKGRIVAMDTDERRLMKSKARIKKARAHDCIELRAIEVEQNRRWLRRQKGTFDVVLLDVPCSGSGTWRRNPDMRWRTYGPSMEELTQIQAEILEKTAKCVKPGGRLVYATCSLFREENENQVENFLETHPDFTLKPVQDVLPQLPPFTNAQGDSPYMRLTPHRHQTDGFFGAVMVRA